MFWHKNSDAEKNTKWLLNTDLGFQSRDFSSYQRDFLQHGSHVEIFMGKSI